MRVVVGFGGGGFAANLTEEGLLPRVHFHVIVQIIFAGEFLVAARALVTPDSVVLRYVALHVGLVGELHAALVAHKLLNALVRAQHVTLQLIGARVRLLAQLTLVRARAHHPMLPHVIVQVALGGEPLLAGLALERLQALVDDPNVLVDGGLVERLLANGTRSVEASLLAFRHEVGLVTLSNMTRQTRTVHENFAAKRTLFGLLLVRFFPVPIQSSLRSERFAAFAKQDFSGFLGGQGLGIDGGRVPAFVLRQIAVSLETLAANVAGQRRLARVSPNVFQQLGGSEKSLLAVLTRKVAHFEVPASMFLELLRFAEFFAALETLVRFFFEVTRHVFD